ncbi:MAG: MFS transporter [Planctomycetes bacterium]|nr:MFS transporter [Planctomycetota bacterium]
MLRHRHFRNVWFGAFGSSVGNLMEFVGLSWVINVTTDKPQLWLGWHAAAQLAPMMILGIVGGVLADRVNRKKLLIATQAIMMVIAATLTIASYGRYPTIATVMTLTALLGAVGAFNVPAWQVLTPRLVPRAELTEAIVLNGLQFNMARVIGPALGGVLLGLFGPFALFAINTFSFLGVMFAVSTTPDAPAPPRVEGKSVWAELREALSFIYHRKGPWAAFLAMTVYGLLGAPLQRMLPQYASEVYFTRDLPKGQQEITYGLLLATMGLGAIGGAFLMRGLPKWYPKHHLIPIAVLVSGVCMAAFGAARSMWIGIPMLLVCGAGWLISFNATYAAMQLLVPDAMRGRVLAICNTAVFGVMGLGPVLSGYIGGLIADRMTPVAGIQMGVAGAGAILAAAGIVMLIWRTPEVDGLHPGDPGYDHRPGVFAGITASAHRPRPTQAD